MTRKGNILAGGSGTRLYPSALATSKHLMPIFDKPMIYYPLTVLVLAGNRVIVVITTPQDQGRFRRLLGDGSQWGLDFTYVEQPSHDGLAEAYIPAEGFLNGAPNTMVPDDNIFFGHGLPEILSAPDARSADGTILVYHVTDPERYGVVRFDAEGNADETVEKPKSPPSNYAVAGLYFLDGEAPVCARMITLSARGEPKLVTVLETYLREGSLPVERIGRGYAWFDTGTHNVLLNASNFVCTLSQRQGLQSGSPEEIACQRGLIDAERLVDLAEPFKNNEYGAYLKRQLPRNLA